ncbi:MAG: hypothetical protein ACREJM_09165, partial [Candidatus Saccharimonadales bacterium]
MVDHKMVHQSFEVLQRHASLVRPVAWVAAFFFAGAAQAATFQVAPPTVKLTGNFARAQLVVTALGPEGALGERSPDLTHQATYASTNPQVISATSSGLVLAVGNGQAAINVIAGGETLSVPVEVSGVADKPQIGFGSQVLAVLSKSGCNAGACHASQYGKGGFKLSVFSFAPNDDHAAITRDRQGRRVDPLNADRSLFLLKPTMAVPHGGGKRLAADSVDYQLLKAWLVGGAPGPKPDEPQVKSIRVWPPRRVGQPGMTQQLQVMATYADGATRDVTCWSRFDSLDDSVVKVTPEGFFTTVGKGQSCVMARFAGQAEVATVVAPYAEQVDL